MANIVCTVLFLSLALSAYAQISPEQFIDNGLPRMLQIRSGPSIPTDVAVQISAIPPLPTVYASTDYDIILTQVCLKITAVISAANYEQGKWVDSLPVADKQAIVSQLTTDANEQNFLTSMLQTVSLNIKVDPSAALTPKIKKKLQAKCTLCSGIASDSYVNIMAFLNKHPPTINGPVPPQSVLPNKK